MTGLEVIALVRAVSELIGVGVVLVSAISALRQKKDPSKVTGFDKVLERLSIAPTGLLRSSNGVVKKGNPDGQ